MELSQKKEGIWEVIALTIHQHTDPYYIQKEKQEYTVFLKEKGKVNPEVRFVKSE